MRRVELFFLSMPVPIAFNACRANKVTLQTRVFIWDCDTIIWKKKLKVKRMRFEKIWNARYKSFGNLVYIIFDELLLVVQSVMRYVCQNLWSKGVKTMPRS